MREEFSVASTGMKLYLVAILALLVSCSADDAASGAEAIVDTVAAESIADVAAETGVDTVTPELIADVEAETGVDTGTPELIADVEAETGVDTVTPELIADVEAETGVDTVTPELIADLEAETGVDTVTPELVDTQEDPGVDACIAQCGDSDCGPDGCGGSCGTCDAGDHCVSGACVVNALTPGFVAIAAGSYWMGSPAGEACPEGYTGGGCPDSGTAMAEPMRVDGRETLHKVTLTVPFELMAMEVTQGDWKALASAQDQSWSVEPSYYSSCGDGDTCPVELVNWYEALAYANAKSSAAGLEECYVLSGCSGVIGGGCAGSVDEEHCYEGAYQCTSVALKSPYVKPQDCEGYRLPTDAEWEYAYRAGSSTAFYPSPGNDGSIKNLVPLSCDPDENLDQIAWHCGNDSGSPAPVGGKEANAWGLVDMAGNVEEWCADGYIADLGSSDESDPFNEATTLTNQVTRGGSWILVPKLARAAFRNHYVPYTRYSGVGFRLARSFP
jgi:formylglycine-generating enzyme required for sulfatase activity